MVWTIIALAVLAAVTLIITRIFLSYGQDHIPGPKTFAWSKWRLAWEDWKGTRTRTINELHKQYGPAIRIGPNELHFNSVTALRTIYGAGSGFERTSFYRMFDAYGHQNLFTFASVQSHAARKKLLAHEYSKSVILKGPAAALVQEKVAQYLLLIESSLHKPHEIFSSLHYFSIDTITHFLYGPHFGGTSAIQGDKLHRDLLNDVLDPARRRLSWFAVHMPRFTKWLYTRTGAVEKALAPLLPMKKPSTYAGIRKHALDAWHSFSSQVLENDDASAGASAKAKAKDTVISSLSKHHVRHNPTGLTSLSIASECADHLLAGIDTTADTLMFLLWSLSLPHNLPIQRRLRSEVLAISPMSGLNAAGIPTVEACDKLPYLDAVIKETLRLYAPLPASEPRSLPRDTVIDGYRVRKGTVVNVAPYSMHRNAEVFEEPLAWKPERWLVDSDEDAVKVAEMKKWWCAFGTGARSCIGVHLATSETKTLTAALYRTYSTTITPPATTDHEETKSPAITSRFELFHDERMPLMQEHTCWIDFRRLNEG